MYVLGGVQRSEDPHTPPCDTFSWESCLAQCSPIKTNFFPKWFQKRCPDKSSIDSGVDIKRGGLYQQ